MLLPVLVPGKGFKYLPTNSLCKLGLLESNFFWRILPKKKYTEENFFAMHSQYKNTSSIRLCEGVKLKIISRLFILAFI